MAENTLIFTLIGRDLASPKFIAAARSAHQLEGRMSGLKVAAAGALIGVASIAVKFAKDSVKAYAEAEQGQAQLEGAFKRFPALANVSIDSLRELNSALQKKTKFDDDAIASGQSVLAQFKLTGAQIRDVTPLLLDYAARTGKDVPEAARDLGKALLGNTKALKNVGVNYHATGDSTRDFANITDLMRKKVGGFAEEEGKTAAGQLMILKNQFGEVEEKVGSKLLPALTKLITVGLGVLDWTQRNWKTLKILGIVLGTTTVAVYAFSTAAKIQAAILAAGGILKYLKALQLVRGATIVWTAAQWLLNFALTANPIGIVVVGLAALAVAIVIAWKRSETFRRIVTGAFDAVKGTVLGVKTAALDLVTFFTSTGPKMIAGLKAGIVGELKSIKNWVRDHIVNPIVDNVKLFFGISSPSKVFSDIGGHLVGGLIKGMSNHDMSKIIGKVFGSMPAALRAIVNKSLIAVGKLPMKAMDALGNAVGIGQPLGGPVGNQSNVGIVRTLAARYGWATGYQWTALRTLITGESGFRNTAKNPTSSAYGLFQFLDSTWGSVGGSKTSDPWQQTILGLRYIAQKYGSPAQAFAAWSSRSPHWYDMGGALPPGLSFVGNATGRPEAVFTQEQMRDWFGSGRTTRLHPDDLAALARSVSFDVRFDDDRFKGLVRVEAKKLDDRQAQRLTSRRL